REACTWCAGGAGGGVGGGGGLGRAEVPAPAIGGGGDDLIDHFFGQQLGDRDAAASRIARQRNHRVAVPAENEGRNVFDRNVQSFGQEAAHPRRIENARHSHYPVFRESRLLPGHLGHRVERIRDDDDDGVRRVFDDLFGHTGD